MAPKTKAAASGSSATAVVTAPAIPKAANSAAAPLPASTAAPVLPKPRRATPQRTPPLVTAEWNVGPQQRLLTTTLTPDVHRAITSAAWSKIRQAIFVLLGDGGNITNERLYGILSDRRLPPGTAPPPKKGGGPKKKRAPAAKKTPELVDEGDDDNEDAA